jgi:putative transposase
MKYRPDYPGGLFVSLFAALTRVNDFVRWYNEDHQQSGIRFVTPDQRHAGQDGAILENRKKVYAAARTLNPQRWARRTRNWDRIEIVELNPAVRSGQRKASANASEGLSTTGVPKGRTAA